MFREIETRMEYSDTLQMQIVQKRSADVFKLTMWMNAMRLSSI